MNNRDQLYKYRGNKCASCGMSVIEMVKRYNTFNRMFEFHHVDPKTKHIDYNNLISRNISSDQIEEVDKCVLLCRQCHGIIHAQQLEGKMTAETSINGRVISQEFKGWFIHDQLDKSLTFITNNNFLLQPCIVKLGDQDEIEYCILELMQNGLMMGWLDKIAEYDSITILSLHTRKLLLLIQHQSGKQVNIKMSLGFPVFAMNFHVDEGPSSYLWMRNGIVLTKEGEVISTGEINLVVNLDKSLTFASTPTAGSQCLI